MEQKLRIPLIKFFYLISRKRKKRNNLCVLRGGKMNETEFEKYTLIVNELTNGNK